MYASPARNAGSCAPALDDERDVGVGAEEGERQEAAEQDRGRQARRRADRPGRRQPGERRHADREPEPDQHDRHRPTGPTGRTTISPAPSDEDDGERQPAPIGGDLGGHLGLASHRSGAGATARIAGSVRLAEMAMSGRRPRKTIRQSHSSVTAEAAIGPMTPGRIHAVESVANIRGRRRSGHRPPDRDVGDGRDRAGAEALDDPGDDEDRHRRRQAADQQPDREQPDAEHERPGEPAPVDQHPGDAIPSRLPRKKPEKTQP